MYLESIIHKCWGHSVAGNESGVKTYTNMGCLDSIYVSPTDVYIPTPTHTLTHHTSPLMNLDISLQII
jgi:hypothetical protein